MVAIRAWPSCIEPFERSRDMEATTAFCKVSALEQTSATARTTKAAISRGPASSIR